MLDNRILLPTPSSPYPTLPASDHREVRKRSVDPIIGFLVEQISEGRLGFGL